MTDAELEKMRGMMLDWPLAKVAFFMGYSSPMDDVQEATSLNPGHGISFGALNPISGMGFASEPDNGSAGADFNMLINTPIVPISHSKELVSQDPYLTQSQKGQVMNIFNAAPGGNSLSMTDLTAGALKLGIQGAAGAVVGYGMGKVFGLPKETTRILSVTGGLANILTGLGIRP